METIGNVMKVGKEGKAIQLDNGEWYSHFVEKVNCKVNDTIKITYTDNTKNDRTFHNWTKIEITNVGKVEETRLDENARLRRATDCILAADEDFRNDKITKEQIAEHAKGLYNLISVISKNEKIL